MFERFTERARQVVVLAREEARGLKHNYIGTEHILLGLLREEEGGLAVRVLASLDIRLEHARAEVVRIVGSGEEVTAGHRPFTPRAKKVLELALREALDLGHNYIGTEHILLGLVRENEGVASRIMLDSGADAERVRDEVIRMLSGPGARPRVERSSPAAGRREEVHAAPTADPERLAGADTHIPRRRARRMVQEAILRYDFEAESKLGAEGLEAMVEEILDANPDVEPRPPAG